MFWLRRPPYLRWITAAAILCAGMALDLRPEPVVAYPFTSDAVSAGEPLSSITWRDVPDGILPEWDRPPTGTATVDIAAATPILPAMMTDGVAPPPGWWVISLPMPGLVPPGTPVRIVVEGDSAEGITADDVVDNGFELTAPVAFPPEAAESVAAMVANSALVVMTGS